MRSCSACGGVRSSADYSSCVVAREQHRETLAITRISNRRRRCWAATLEPHSWTCVKWLVQHSPSGLMIPAKASPTETVTLECQNRGQHSCATAHKCHARLMDLVRLPGSPTMLRKPSVRRSLVDVWFSLESQPPSGSSEQDGRREQLSIRNRPISGSLVSLIMGL